MYHHPIIGMAPYCQAIIEAEAIALDSAITMVTAPLCVCVCVCVCVCSWAGALPTASDSKSFVLSEY